MEMEILEAREATLRRRVLGGGAKLDHAAYPTQTILERLGRVNAQVEQLHAAIAGFSRLSDLYNANRHLIELQRSSATSISALQPGTSGDELKRAVILSSEEHIERIVAEFKKLRELQRYIAQLEQLRTSTPSIQNDLESLEATHSLQEERALLVHARVEKLLTIYQEMISFLTCA